MSGGGAMAEKLAFELVSPERVLASGEAEMVVVPGSEGDFGVLPLHAPTLSLLRPGVIRIYEGDRVQERIFVAGGFAEVRPEGLIVLAEEAEPVARIDREEALARVRDLEEDLAEAKDEEERARIERRLEVARARAEAPDSPS